MEKGRVKRILIFVEFKLRDLPAAALIKFFLESKYNYDVMLASPLSERLTVPSFRPHLVIYSHLRYPSSVARAKTLKKMGIAVAILPTEGVSVLESSQLVNAGKFTDLSAVDIHFVWNAIVAETMEIHRTLSPDRIAVTGNPRFDFYFPPFNRPHLSKALFCRKYGLGPDRPIVTWATNFGWARLAGNSQMMEDAEVRYKEEGVAHLFPWSDIPAHVKREEECRRIQAEGFVRLAQSLPGVNFVIKPHPVEHTQWYFDLRDRAGLKNVAVVSKEYIWDVLNSTDVHLHRCSCTTSHEAWLMRKPTIALLLYPNEWFFSQELAEGGDVARSVDELKSMVSRYLQGGTVSSEHAMIRERLIEKWYSQVNGGSAERHADVIHAFLEKARIDPKVRLSVEFFREVARARLRRLLGLEYHHSLRAWFSGHNHDSREKFITMQDVEEWMDRIVNLRLL